jgi:hypothetical protein
VRGSFVAHVAIAIFANALGATRSLATPLAGRFGKCTPLRKCEKRYNDGGGDDTRARSCHVDGDGVAVGVLFLSFFALTG